MASTTLSRSELSFFLELPKSFTFLTFTVSHHSDRGARINVRFIIPRRYRDIVLFPPDAEGESGLRAAEHQPHLPADTDPAGQEGEGPGVRIGRGKGGAAAERVRHAGRNRASPARL